MEQGSNNVNAKMVPGAVLILLGLLFLLGGIGLFNVFGRLIGAALFGGLANYVYQQGKRQDNQVMQLAALPLAGLALASIFPSFVGGGLFLAAIQMMGLVTLTHTPNPMGFLRDLLGRGTNEKAVLVMPVGYPRPDAKVPDLQRLPLEAIVQWNA